MSQQNNHFKQISFWMITAAAFSATTVFSADRKATPQPAASDSAPASAPSALGGDEKVNVDNIKQKYWARGDESEMSVVQNRTYSKARRFELGVMGGFVSTDPFLSVKGVGGNVGYHFTEYFGLSVFGWKDMVNNSSALDTFKSTLGTEVNDNAPKYFLGTEAQWSVLYGKLSLLGKSIIYYDLHLLAGVGVTSTENGNYPTPSIGIGQDVYLSQNWAIRVDYRAMRYNERIKEKVVPQRLGQDDGGRVNWTNSVMIGVTYLFGSGGAKR